MIAYDKNRKIVHRRIVLLALALLLILAPAAARSEALRHGRRNLRDAVVGFLRREPQAVPGRSSTQA